VAYEQQCAVVEQDMQDRDREKAITHSHQKKPETKKKNDAQETHLQTDKGSKAK